MGGISRFLSRARGEILPVCHAYSLEIPAGDLMWAIFHGSVRSSAYGACLGWGYSS